MMTDNSELIENVLRNLFRWSKIREDIYKDHPASLKYIILDDFMACRTLVSDLTELVLAYDSAQATTDYSKQLIEKMIDYYDQSSFLIQHLEENLLLSTIARKHW